MAIRGGREGKEEEGFLKRMKNKEREGKRIKIINIVVFGNLIRRKEEEIRRNI